MLIAMHAYESTRERLLSEIAGLGEEELNWKPNDSSWSIAQVVEHISKAEDSIAQLIPIGLAQSPTYEQRDLRLQQFIPDRSSKIQAPDRLEPSKEPQTYEQLVSLLAQSRARTIAILNSITDTSLLSITSPAHPHLVFGPMSTGQWIDTIPLHEMRHIHQIEELKEQMKGN